MINQFSGLLVPRAEWGGATVPDGALWQVPQVSLTLDQLQTSADCSPPRDSQGAPKVHRYVGYKSQKRKHVIDGIELLYNM